MVQNVRLCNRCAIGRSLAKLVSCYGWCKLVKNPDVPRPGFLHLIQAFRVGNHQKRHGLAVRRVAIAVGLVGIEQDRGPGRE